MEPNFKMNVFSFQSRLWKLCLIFNPIPLFLYLCYKIQFGQTQDYLASFREILEALLSKETFEKHTHYQAIKISLGCLSGIALLIVYQIWTFGSI